MISCRVRYIMSSELHGSWSSIIKAQGKDDESWLNPNDAKHSSTQGSVILITPPRLLTGLGGWLAKWRIGEVARWHR